jgi:hypothetical protein
MSIQSLRIGIETEVLMKPRHSSSETVFRDLDEFVAFVVDQHNEIVGTTSSRMHSDIDGVYNGANAYLEWSLTDD